MTKKLIDDFHATPTQELIIDLLQARLRLGENVWTFSPRVKPALKGLQEAGIIGYKNGVVEDTVIAFFTKEAKEEALSGSYIAPIFDKYVLKSDIKKSKKKNKDKTSKNKTDKKKKKNK